MSIEISDGMEVEIEQLVKVVNAALLWDSMYRARASTIPEDDELHWAVRRLIKDSNRPTVSNVGEE